MEETAVDKIKELEEKVPETPDYHTIGMEFSDQVGDLIQEYAKVIPLIFIVKILQNLTADVIFQNAAAQAHYRVEKLKEELAPKSKILL